MRKTVQSYYQHWESNLGYQLFLGGSQHFGYYLEGKSNISEPEAQKEHHNIIAAKLSLNAEDNVLDAGCGQGFVACDLAKRFHCKITGIDITPYVVNRARARSRRESIAGKTSFIEGSYEQLPFADNTFDKLYTVETLCHAQNLEKALTELYRVVKPGGKLVFMEYTQKPVSSFTQHEQEMYNIVVEGTSSPSLSLFANDSFVKSLQTNFVNVTQTDITDNFEPSLYRLYKYAQFPYVIINALGLHKHFVNVTIGVEFYKMAKKHLLGYCIYTAEKPRVQ